MKNSMTKNIFFTLSLLSLFGCGDQKRTFSVLSDSEVYEQSKSTAAPKIDILWVIDGSGTMANHQENLGTNFGNFINKFVSKNIDFRMAITSTDAWVREKDYNAGGCSANPNSTHNPNQIYTSSADCHITVATYGQLTQFRDGDIYGTDGGGTGSSTHSGQFLISSLMTPTDITSLFTLNAKVGTRGDGTRESGFASVRAVLRRNEDGTIGYSGETHTQLADFKREGVFLAVIFVSDEDDQSKKQNGTSYADVNEYVSSFKGFMDAYTESVEGNRKYNISSIVVPDINNCSYGLHGEARQGDKYVAISNATDGIAASICSNNFSSALQTISDQIVTLATRFQLMREPVEGSITVKVGGQSVPNSSKNGWVFVKDNGYYFVEFHGTAVPEAGAQIQIDFDPVNLQQ